MRETLEPLHQIASIERLAALTLFTLDQRGEQSVRIDSHAGPMVQRPGRASPH